MWGLSTSSVADCAGDWLELTRKLSVTGAGATGSTGSSKLTVMSVASRPTAPTSVTGTAADTVCPGADGGNTNAAPDGNWTCGLPAATVPAVAESAAPPMFCSVTVSCPVSPLSSMPSASQYCGRSLSTMLSNFSPAVLDEKLSTTPAWVVD